MNLCRDCGGRLSSFNVGLGRCFACQDRRGGFPGAFRLREYPQEELPDEERKALLEESRRLELAQRESIEVADACVHRSALCDQHIRYWGFPPKGFRACERCGCLVAGEFRFCAACAEEHDRTRKPFPFFTAVGNSNLVFCFSGCGQDGVAQELERLVGNE